MSESSHPASRVPSRGLKRPCRAARNQQGSACVQSRPTCATTKTPHRRSRSSSLQDPHSTHWKCWSAESRTRCSQWSIRPKPREVVSPLRPAPGRPQCIPEEEIFNHGITSPIGHPGQFARSRHGPIPLGARLRPYCTFAITLQRLKWHLKYLFASRESATAARRCPCE